MTAPPQSRHLSVFLDRPAGEVYDFVCQPATLPRRAAGPGSSIAEVGGQWVAESPMDSVVVELAERNSYGVLDHRVTWWTGRVSTTRCG